MTDSTIGVAEPGTPTKLLQSYQNTVSSQTVQAEGVVQVDLNGLPVPRGSAADPKIVAEVNSNNLRQIEERLMMLAETAALNSLIASDNGPGARNYQELR
jgi:hypothetical protein